MTSFSEVKQPELESYHSSLPTIQNYASNVASSAPRTFMTLFLIPGIIVSNTVVLTRAVAERNMRPACGLVDTKPGTDVTRTTVVAGCLHQQVGTSGRVPTASIRPHSVVLHYEQRGPWDTPDELNQLFFYMYQKKPPVLTSTTTSVTLTEGFGCFLSMFRRDYHLQIIGLFLSGFLFMNINVSTSPWSSYLSSTNWNLFIQKTKDSFSFSFNPLNAKLNPICHLLALLGAHHILHVSRIRVNKLYVNFCSRGSTVGIVTKRRPGRSGVRTPGRTRDLSLLRNVMTVSGSRPVDSEIFSRGKAMGMWCPRTSIYC